MLDLNFSYFFKSRSLRDSTVDQVLVFACGLPGFMSQHCICPTSKTGVIPEDIIKNKS